MAAANFPIILVSLCKYFLYPFFYSMLKMSCGKGRNWHFRDPKFKNFLGEQSKSFSFVRATSKSYSTPLDLEVYLLDKKLCFFHLQFIRLR